MESAMSRQICVWCLSQVGCNCYLSMGRNITSFDQFLAGINWEMLAAERTHLASVASDPNYHDQREYCVGKIDRIDKLLKMRV